MTEIKTRPIWNDGMRAELAKYCGGLVNKWCNNETDLDQCVEDAERILRYNYRDDGYTLAKEFEDKGYSADSELVEVLDGISYQQYQIQESHIKAWVKDNNVALLLPLDTKVTATIGGKKCAGEVVKLYPEKAQYGIWVESEGKPKGTSHYLIDSENVLPESTPNLLK